jgi:predicted Zn-dependent protease
MIEPHGRAGACFAVVSLALTLGCATNPVTGKSELMLVSEAQELSIGQQQYVPMQQSEGGRYDVDPELTAYVAGVGQRLAAVSDRELPYEFVILNNNVPNAWALPGGKIAINRGLLTELHSETELAAVLGHEIVHAAARHSAQQMSRGILLQGAVLGTAIATSDSDYGMLAVGGAALGSQLVNARYGRGAELESDEYGMRYMSRAGYDPSGAVVLQETFVRLSEGRREDWLSGLFASHPPSRERVEANVRTAAQLPPGGELGVTRYEAAMARSRKAAPAYEAYDQGRKALAEGRTADALGLAARAMKLFPDEANFYSLRGDVRLVQNEYEKAIENYNSAIRRRPDFFYYHLQRGLARRETGDVDAAVIDLENANALLPTAPAHYTLGLIEESRGNRDKALGHYRVVAQSGGDYGKAAQARVVRYELPSAADRYVPFRCDAGGDGNLVVTIRNDAGIAIRDVEIAVQYADASGTRRELRRTLRGPFEPGEVAPLATGLGPYNSAAGCPVSIVTARVAD